MKQTAPPSTIEAVLKSLRHGGRDLSRQPRAALRAAATQLLRVAGPEPAPQPPDIEYRIDDLARESGTTTRNIRAYQERGLLHPPRRSGRLGLYDQSHLARLRIINSMLDRGYTTAHITEMLTAWEHGKDLADVLGLEKVLVTGWAEDRPLTTTPAKARNLAGGEQNLTALVDAGLVEITDNGGTTTILRPKLLEAFTEMRTYGMSTDAVIALYAELQPSVESISRTLVRAGAQQLTKHFDPAAQPDAAHLAHLVPMLVRFRTLALSSMTASISAALEVATEDILGDHLALLVEPSADVERPAS